jgi:glutathione S-transferase
VGQAVLTLSSKNYSSWCLRGWLLCRIAGLAVEEKAVPVDDPDARAELLLLSPSFLVPSLEHEGVRMWDTLAIGEYLAEQFPDAGLLPRERAARAQCRSICGEMHSGFANLRSALPMNLKAVYSDFKVWSGAQPDIARIELIWRECLAMHGGEFLFGAAPGMADAMYAPVCARFTTYDVRLSPLCESYRDRVMNWAPMREWIGAAKSEPEQLEELDVEF